MFTDLSHRLRSLIRRRREQTAVMQRLSTLTRREREVLLLVCRGADSRSIAEELVISPETARTHVQNVLSPAHTARLCRGPLHAQTILRTRCSG